MNLYRYDGTVRAYTATELSALLTRLIAQGQTSCLGNDDVSMIRVDNVGVLLVDVAWVVGRRLSELYIPISDSTMPFGLRWTLLGQGAYTLTQALSGSGYVGLSTVTDLSTVHMLLFMSAALPYLEAGQLVAEQGYVENVAARLKTLAAGDNIELTTEGEVITISTSAALASDLSNLQAEIDTKQPALLSLPSLPGSGRYDLFDGIGFKSLSAAVPISIANDGTNLALSLDSSGFQPIFNPVFPLSIASSSLQSQSGLTCEWTARAEASRWTPLRSRRSSASISSRTIRWRGRRKGRRQPRL